MDKPIIIGGGFSAWVASILQDGQVPIYTPSLKLSKNLHHNLIRRRELEINKLFIHPYAKSVGTLNFARCNVNMHDRVILGGNSTIWGGFINLKSMPKHILYKIENSNVSINKLNQIYSSRYATNEGSIYQLRGLDNSILDCSKYIKKFYDYYLDKLYVTETGIKLQFISTLGGNTLEIDTSGKVYLCIGLIQLLDVLSRSNLIANDSIIELCEFKSEFKMNKFTNKLPDPRDEVVIRYGLGAAIKHLTGIKKDGGILKLLDKFNICIDQIYTWEKNQASFKLRGNCIEREINDSDINFGKSIHYCNLTINGMRVNQHLANISKNLIGIGMPFINQEEPGPISNDILIHAIKVINED